MHKGVWVSLITPFDQENKFDSLAAERYVALQDRYNFSGFLIGGSVGEGNLLTEAELAQYIAIVRKISKKPIMIAIAAFCYEQALPRLALDYDYLCVTPPIYYMPHKQAIIEYFKIVAQASRKPIVLYNNPSRVSVEINDEIYSHLYDREKIIAVKECDDDQFDAVSNKYLRWLWMSGNDNFAANPFFLNNYNAGGVISTLANIAPDLAIKLWEYKIYGQNFQVNYDSKVDSNNILSDCAKKWTELCKYAYSLPNPQAVKLTLAHWGIIKPYFRAQFYPLPNFDYVAHFPKPSL